MNWNEWQPIATAPKDGKILLIWAKREGFNLGRWHDVHKAFCHIDIWSHAFCSYGPTHWLPLPEPPDICERINAEQHELE